MNIVIFESMLSAQLVGHEIWLRDIVKGLQAATPANITIVGQRTMSQAVCAAIGLNCRFVAAIKENYLKSSLGAPSVNKREYFPARKQMAEETARLIEQFADADLHIFPTAMPTTAAGVAMARKRAKKTSLLFHFGHDELADAGLLEQNSVLDRFQHLAVHSVQCLATSPGLATELQELGIPTALAPYPYHRPTYQNAERKVCRRIGLFGHQRADKDGGLLWPLINDLVSSGFEVVFQDSSGKPSVFNHPALTHVNQFLRPPEFMELMQTCDLIIIPNEARFFSHRISGVTLDALGAAIPLVVPNNTHMSRLVRRFNAGTVYDERTPQAVHAAVVRAKRNFTACASGAFQAANWLSETGGYHRLASAFLGSSIGSDEIDPGDSSAAGPGLIKAHHRERSIQSEVATRYKATGKHRSEIINAIITAINASGGSYLEIGVRRVEDNFNKVACAHKWSVDPGYENPNNPATYKVTSDVFFDSLARGEYPELPATFDVIFVDGLHTADQAYRDACNALQCLAPGGVVVMHDCSPPSEAHSRADYADKLTPAGGNWNGTVWKAFTRLRKNPDLSCFCVPDDWGVGIVLPAAHICQSLETSFNSFYDYGVFDENRVLSLGLVTLSEAIQRVSEYAQLTGKLGER